METERQKHLKRLRELFDIRRQPGGSVVISLSEEREKREARANAKRMRQRLPPVSGPWEENDDGPGNK